MNVFESDNFFAKFLYEEMKCELSKLQNEVGKEEKLYLLYLSPAVKIYRFQKKAPVVSEILPISWDTANVLEDLIEKKILLTRPVQDKAMELIFAGGKKKLLVPDTWFFFVDKLIDAKDYVLTLYRSYSRDRNLPHPVIEEFENVHRFFFFPVIEDWRDVIACYIFLKALESLLTSELNTLSEYYTFAADFFSQLARELSRADHRLLNVLPADIVEHIEVAIKLFEKDFPRRIPNDKDFAKFLKDNVKAFAFIYHRGIDRLYLLLTERSCDTLIKKCRVEDILHFLYFPFFSPQKFEALLKKIGFLKSYKHTTTAGGAEYWCGVLEINSFDDLLFIESLLDLAEEFHKWILRGAQSLAEMWDLHDDAEYLYEKILECCLKVSNPIMLWKITKRYHEIGERLVIEGKQLVERYLVLPAKYARKLPLDRFFQFLITLLFVV